MANKGTPYERKICGILSKWWTEDARDDVFWRSAASGARATMRRGRGKATANQDGDITATDPIGNILTDLFVIELKRGYKKWSVMDEVDALEKAATQQLTEFWQQVAPPAYEQGKQPMLIFQRDRRQSCVVISLTAYQALEGYTDFEDVLPWLRLDFMFGNEHETIIIMRLTDFLSTVDADILTRLHSHRAIHNIEW